MQHKLFQPGLILVFLAFFSLTACTSNNLDGEDFVAPVSLYHSWEQVFEQAPAFQLEILDTGSLNVPLEGLLNLANPNAKGLVNRQVRLHALAYLLRREGKDYLIDTGFDSSFTDQGGNIHGWITKPERYSQVAGTDLLSQLKERDAQVNTVFFTHLHPDHMSGVPELPSTVRLVYNANETYINYPPLIGTDQLAGKTDLVELDFSKAPSMPILGPCIDYFGDGSLWAIATPGHSSGHVSWLIKGKDHSWLVCGDASHTRWGFEHGVEPGSFNTGDRSQAQESLSRLRAFAATYPDTLQVLYGHDLADQALEL